MNHYRKISLTESQFVLLERLRVQYGYKSVAATIRALATARAQQLGWPHD